MLIKVLFLIAVLFINGCATKKIKPVWLPTARSQISVTESINECAYENSKMEIILTQRKRGLLGKIRLKRQLEEFFDLCMKANGFHAWLGPEIKEKEKRN